MDLTEAFAPGGGGEDLPKTDFFDFVVSPPPHSSDVVSDEESFLHRTTTCRSIGYLQQSHEEHETRDIHGSPFIKETNNNTLTALPPVSTITGSLSHHHRTHHAPCNVQPNPDQVPMDQDCDYWGSDENKEQTCNILLEDLNKYCWSNQSHSNDGVSVHQTTTNDHHHHHHHHHQHQQTVARCATDRQNTDGAIYTLTVLNNEANSMDALDCCKSPPPTSSDSWSLRPNLDLDAILNLEPTSTDQEHEQSTNVNDVTRNVNERFHAERFSVPSSQYTDDSGFVESKELCRTSTTNNNCGDNNNDWKLSDQNLQEAAAAAAAAVAVGNNDSAESLLRSALQGKLYTGPAQVVSSSPSPQTSSIPMPVTSNAGLLVEQQSQPQQQQQTQAEDSMHACTDEDLLLSQLDQTTYRPGDYEKLKSIANEVVESYCSLEPVCNVSATTTVMYTLDPASGSLGTITLPADLGQVSTVTVVTAPQDVLQQTPTPRNEVEPQQTAPAAQLPIPARSSTKAPKKYCRRANRNSNSNGASNGSSGNEASTGGQQQNSGGSPGSVQRKERSLHYCSICSKGFKDKYSVNVHIRTHTGEKPFACSLCGKSFRQKAHLAKHYQTHVTQKPSVVQQGASNGGNSGNPSPSAETGSVSSGISSRSQHQVSPGDPSAGGACNPPS